MTTQTSVRCALAMALAVGVSAHAADSSPVSLSNVQVEFREGLRSDGKVYPRISADVLIKKKSAKGMGLSSKASCQVGDKRMSDKALAMAKWDDLDEGETQRVDMAPFVTQPLDAQPSTCEFSVRWGKLFGGDPKEIAKFCWTPEGVKDGACPKSK